MHCNKDSLSDLDKHSVQSSEKSGEEIHQYNRTLGDVQGNSGTGNISHTQGNANAVGQ